MTQTNKPIGFEFRREHNTTMGGDRELKEDLGLASFLGCVVIAGMVALSHQSQENQEMRAELREPYTQSTTNNVVYQNYKLK
jgi:hypothetical protein